MSYHVVQVSHKGTVISVHICQSDRDPGCHTCEDVGKGVSACDLECRVFGSKHVEKERGQAAQNAQEAEGGDDPQQQDSLGVHTII